MLDQRKPFSTEVDWEYREGCGCRVVFKGEAHHRSSEMTACAEHNRRDQSHWRDYFVNRARRQRAMEELAAGPPE